MQAHIHVNSAQPPAAFGSALEFHLCSARTQGQLEALVLADEHGLVLAKSGDHAVCAELAAIAPLLGESAYGVPLPPLLRGTEVAVRSVQVYNSRLFLAAIGGVCRARCVVAPFCARRAPYSVKQLTVDSAYGALCLPALRLP